jgi:hypothetical protein
MFTLKVIAFIIGALFLLGVLVTIAAIRSINKLNHDLTEAARNGYRASRWD